MNVIEKYRRVGLAQKQFATFDQKQVDHIFAHVASVANKARITLAKLAVDETNMGVFEDKVIKNHFASEYIYNAYKNAKTCGVIESDPYYMNYKIAQPVGVIAAIIPTTNPTSTTIFKILIALKTRNGLIISPHPRARNCTIATAKLMLEAAVAAGAPDGIIDWLDEPSVQNATQLMQCCDLILATGGPGMVKAAYSSGKPAIGVGSGNVPVVVDESADIKMTVASILSSKSFDNGMICASEQAVIVYRSIYMQFKQELLSQGAYILNTQQTKAVGKIILINGSLNPQIVGQSPSKIATMAKIKIPSKTRILVGEVSDHSINEPFAHEKLSPVLALYQSQDFNHSVIIAKQLLNNGGLGHTASLFIDPNSSNQTKIDYWQSQMNVGRCLINSPSSFGGVGDLFNFQLPPSLTLGCGTWSGNSVSENVGIKHLLNIKTIAYRRENMLWFKTPNKIYFKRGCLPVAIRELKDDYHASRVFIVTDKFLYEHTSYVKDLTKYLDELNITHTTFYEVSPDPTLACAYTGAKAMTSFQPDVVIALGGGSPIDAAKIMWLLYEHPKIKFTDMTMRFMDIRKRIEQFPQMNTKAHFIAIPTTAGTGSEVTPFAVITDESTGSKYPLADYQLMPTMAIIDSQLMDNMPPSLTAATGIDALTHALEALASCMASDYTNSLSYQAGKMIFTWLPRAYQNGMTDNEARDNMANAACMAGIAFANAFLGVCHAMAHKLGGYFHIPHGIANALLIKEVIKFNCDYAPSKMCVFPQYKYPTALENYATFATHLGIKAPSAKAQVTKLLDKISQLQKTLNLPSSIQEYGINEKMFLAVLDQMSLDAFDDQCITANPRYPLVTEIKEMYKNAYYGKNGNK